jgi:L-fuconolactonase
MIDAHHHLWDFAAREYPFLMGDSPLFTDAELAQLRRSFGLADLAPLAAECGVTGTVVIQTVDEPWETPELLALAAEPSGLLVGVVGWTDLTAPAVEDAVAGLRGLPGGSLLCGIRHPVVFEPDPGWLARPAVLRGLHALAVTGLSFDVVTLEDQLPSVVTAARSVPELTFVLDHLGNPNIDDGSGARDGPWAAAIRSLAALPNVTCKLSGMPSSTATGADDLRPYYETVLEGFGPDRLFFGTDWPVSTLAAPYGQVCGLYRELSGQLTAVEQEAIFEGTARRVYGLQ